MKWSIWIEPNKIIEEIYPNGWSHDEVFEAASARWANKVTTVNPAPTGASSNDNNSSSQSNNNSSSSSNIQLPSLKTLLVGGVVLYGLSLFGGNVTQLKEMVPNTQQMEYSQPTNNQIQFSEHHIDESIPEFFNTELQEEPVNDLGQDWDN